MRKAASLRARLEASWPELRTESANLKMWIEEGGITQHGRGPNFRISYTLIVLLEDWSESALPVWLVVLDWLRTAQPELLTPRGEPSFPFEADHVSASATDISFDLALTEDIQVVPNQQGGHDLRSLDEDQALFEITNVLLASASAKGAQLVPDE